MTPLPPGRQTVDVIILTYNDAELCERAVQSALASETVDVRVWVVDNGSEVPVAGWDDPRVDLSRFEQNQGVVIPRNQAARRGTAPIGCFLDSDARLHPDSLAQLVAPMVADEKIGLTAPVFTDQAPEESAGMAPSFRVKAARVLGRRSDYAALPRADSDATWDIDFAITACVVFRRDGYEAIGGLDESYWYGPEDIDFCLRLKLDGWRVVQVAAAAVDHPPRRRYRKLLSRRGLQHTWAITRHLWRHRNFDKKVPR